jgi:hypothetical protein
LSLKKAYFTPSKQLKAPTIPLKISNQQGYQVGNEKVGIEKVGN